jgi:teichuronic acid biosynthesis glycosyltransferase TuaC
VRRKLSLLTFTTLYPNSANPSHGIFVETRLRHLLTSGDVESRVIAPVPWFPFRSPRFGAYAVHAAAPRQEERHGISIAHPRFVLVPKIGMIAAPYALARSAIAAARHLIAGGYDFDAIDSHYFYPDGVAAMMLGRALGKPVVITARGTDINLIPRYALPRRAILGAARQCAAIITVCAALKDAMIALGVDASKITVLRNGVDLKLFHPEDRATARASFGMTRFALASVGHLIARKGHDLVINALRAMPDTELFIAGSGPENTRLQTLARELGLSARVRFLGVLPQDRLRTLYEGADALVLASNREGWANVLLESMACGTPVVAADVWGTPEVVAAREAGVLMRERSPAGIAEAVRKLRGSLPSREATRRYAEKFSWDDTTRGQVELFARVVAGSCASGRMDGA